MLNVLKNKNSDLWRFGCSIWNPIYQTQWYNIIIIKINNNLINKALRHRFVSLAVTCAVNPPYVSSCSLLYNCPWLNKRMGCFVSRKDAWNIHCTQPSRKHCSPLWSETHEYAVCALKWDFTNLRFIQQCFVLLLTAFSETGFVLLQLLCLSVCSRLENRGRVIGLSLYTSLAVSLLLQEDDTVLRHCIA